MQLDDNSLQRDRDRTMTLRRDVFLPGAEAIARMQAALAQLTNLDADVVQIGQHIADNLGALAKVHLAASESTVRALLRYQKNFMSAYSEIIMIRSALLITKSGIADHQKYIDRADEEIQRIVQLMKQHNIAGSTDQAAFGRLVDQSKIEQDARKNHSEKQSTLRQKLFAGQMGLGEKLAELAIESSGLIPDALISCRQELELPIDAVEYRKLYEEQQEAARAMMREVVRRTRDLVASSAQSDANAPSK
jgi:SAM-dependent MidA family methyltransferase